MVCHERYRSGDRHVISTIIHLLFHRLRMKKLDVKRPRIAVRHNLDKTFLGIHLADGAPVIPNNIRTVAFVDDETQLAWAEENGTECDRRINLKMSEVIARGVMAKFHPPGRRSSRDNPRPWRGCRQCPPGKHRSSARRPSRSSTASPVGISITAARISLLEADGPSFRQRPVIATPLQRNRDCRRIVLSARHVRNLRITPCRSILHITASYGRRHLARLRWLTIRVEDRFWRMISHLAVTLPTTFSNKEKNECN